ncbi:MAG: hypothetical protein ACK451_02155, partial [Pseudanabaena sp.]
MPLLSWLARLSFSSDRPSHPATNREHLPDPEAEAIKALFERIKSLEDEITKIRNDVKVYEPMTPSI